MRRLWTAVIACTLVVSACGNDTATTSSPTTPTAATGLALIGGGELDAAVLDRGPLALWFWAPG